MQRRYFWLKLKEDFFRDKKIKYLRKMPDGDKLLILYLQMQLASLDGEGIIKYAELMPSYVEELALTLDEEPKIVESALVTLQKVGLIEIWEDKSIYMLAMQDCIGSEGTSAERVRRHRERKALKDVAEQLHCNRELNLEKERDIELDGDKEKDREEDKEEEQEPYINNSENRELAKNSNDKYENNFTKPTIEEIRAYCVARKNEIDPEHFFDYYESHGWRTGKNGIQDWRATIRCWEKNNFRNTAQGAKASQTTKQKNYSEEF